MKTNESTYWTSNENECVTLYDDRTKSCVFIEASDGFYFCNADDVDKFAEEVKRRIKVMKDEDWCMGNL